jgi:hypothetical protein
MSVVNVAGPTGAPPRADGDLGVARRANVAAKRDDSRLPETGAEVRGNRQAAACRVGQCERRGREVDAVVVGIVLRAFRGERLQNRSVGAECDGR